MINFSKKRVKNHAFGITKIVTPKVNQLSAGLNPFPVFRRIYHLFASSVFDRTDMSRDRKPFLPNDHYENMIVIFIE